MKILIAGATGMIGKELGKALCSKGHEIIVITRKPANSLKNAPFPHKAVSWDDLENHPETQNVDSIINLAGAGLADKRWSSSYKKTIVESRTKTTGKLVAFANKHSDKIKTFISTSGIGYYGDCKDKVINENQKVAPTFLAQLCHDWEEPLKNLVEARAVIFRVGVVLSEKGGALEKMVPPIQMGFGGPLGSGKQYMSWIDIDDLVNMYVFAIEKPIKGVFNACAPKAVTNKQLTTVIAQRLSKKAFLNVPYISLRLVVGEMASALVESQNASSKKIQQSGFEFTYAKIEDSIIKRVPRLEHTEKRMIYEQWVPSEQDNLFPFFSEAKNLESLTPDSLQFKILNSSTDKVEQGTIINYKLKINGIPVRWKTLITDWNPPHSFVDNQEKGPYKKWHHTHSFIPFAGGTLMRDQVDYIVPLGLFGFSLTHWKIKSDIQTIFKYRREIIYKLYYNLISTKN